MRTIHSIKLAIAALVVGCLLAQPQGAQAKDKFDAKKLAEVAKVFKDRCHRCHGVNQQVPGLDVLNYASLTKAKEGETPWIIKGKPEESELYKAIKSDYMPKGTGGPLTDTQKTLIADWIKSGPDDHTAVPGEVEKERTIVTMKDVLSSINAHLNAQDAEDRPYMRYFTFVNLHNDKRIKADELNRYKAALSKAVNSMHWKRSIIQLDPIDKETTVFGFDMRDLDWDRKDHEKTDRWKEMLKHYPYGLRYDDDPDMKNLDVDVYRHARTLVYMRADWFIAMATRPPLYHTVLRLPHNATTLETKLGVDVASNFKRNRLWRAGYVRSGVSKQNRMIERHESLYGAYWKSYDFKPGTERSNLLKSPLGPDFGLAYGGKHPYADEVTFKHDGGEIIFNLPNGMQGYMLVDGKDKRIDEGPPDVVFDLTETSGSQVIVNGLSCMACHSKGMLKAFKDEIREGTGLAGDLKNKIYKLYPTPHKMQELVKKDETMFLTALKETISRYPTKDDPTSPKYEPIHNVALRYNKDMNLEDVAHELGCTDIGVFKGRIQGSRKLREEGLGTLLKDGVIQRKEWEKFKGGLRGSLMHLVARELEIGNSHVEGK